MKWLIALAMMAIINTSKAQENYDLATFTAPQGWNRADKNGSLEFSKLNNKTKSFAQLVISKTTDSKGSVQDDFKSEWNIFLGPLNTAAPQTDDVIVSDGWNILKGGANFTFNNKPALAKLIVYSGYGKCFSIVATTNSADYDNDIKNFCAGIAINAMALAQFQQQQGGSLDTNGNAVAQNQEPGSAASSPMQTGFAFNSTNFNDGWVSTVQQDWVEVTKGNIKVLLHYPKDGTMYPADADKLTNNAWNILVAPRYSNMQHYKFISPSGDDGSLASKIAMADMTEKSSDRSVFVVLFNRTAGLTEVIVPNVKTFTDEFGFDPTSVRFGTNSHNWGGWIVTTNTGATIDANGSVFTKLDAMLLKNKFAVSAEDLYGTGEWAQNFSSNTFWANTYNGAFEGVSTYAASKWFIFGSGQSYKWHIVAVSTYGGSTNGVKADAEGTFTSLGNWQLYFSNIEGKPKKYDAYFTAIKGGRILWMNDAEHPGSGIFQGFSKK